MITETDKLECERILDEQENQRTYKEGDIVYWGYSQKYIDGLSYKSDLYWANSRIATFDGKKFSDTFWHGYDNFSFGSEEIGEKIEVRYVANFNELDKQSDYTKAEELEKYYESADIVDLNHSNNSRGNLYLRKGAKRSLTKIKENLEYKIDRLNRVLGQEKGKLANLSEETIANLYF